MMIHKQSEFYLIFGRFTKCLPSATKLVDSRFIWDLSPATQFESSWACIIIPILAFFSTSRFASVQFISFSNHRQENVFFCIAANQVNWNLVYCLPSDSSVNSQWGHLRTVTLVTVFSWWPGHTAPHLVLYECLCRHPCPSSSSSN